MPTLQNARQSCTSTNSCGEILSTKPWFGMPSAVVIPSPGIPISALSENLTKRPLLRNFLHPLNCEEPTLVTAIRLAWMNDTEVAGLSEMRREQGCD